MTTQKTFPVYERRQRVEPAVAVKGAPATTLPPMAIKVAGKLYPVETYAEASEKVLAALAKYSGRFGDLPEIGFYEGNRKTGHISTNGKVWLLRGGRDFQVWPPRPEPAATLEITQPPAGTVAAALAAEVK